MSQNSKTSTTLTISSTSNIIPPMLKEYTTADSVVAFSTTRQGGVSLGAYSSFNINEYCGDTAEHIAENRRLLAQRLGIAPDHIILPHQVHGAEVRQIGADFLQLPENERRMIVEGVDALVTNQRGICIGVSTADCIPVLLYDEAHHAVAAIHAGWRGTVQRIVQTTIDMMHLYYHIQPSELRAIIGPGISRDSFEVGDEVYEEFLQEGFDMAVVACQRPNMKKEGSVDQPLKWHIDLPQCNALLLCQSGVPADRIQSSGICTYQHSDQFFSARQLGIQSGRIFTGIMLR